MYTTELHYLNIGQGDCSIIIIKDENENIKRVVVFDCGSSSSSVASNKLISKCKALKITTIHLAFISHFDKDHFNGFMKTLGMEHDDSTTKAYVKGLFMSTLFYTTGCIYKSVKPTKQRKSFPNRCASRLANPYAKNKGRAAVSLLQYDEWLSNMVKTKSDHGMNIQHKTERYFAGFPAANTKFDPENKYVIAQREWHPTDNIEDPNYESPVDSDPPFYLVQFETLDALDVLGQDLLNKDFPDDTLQDMHLYCIAFNKNLKLNWTPGVNEGTVGNAKQANATSIGCVFKCGTTTAWFGGDLEKNEEELLIETIRNISNNNLTILKASHHGASTATSQKFLGLTKNNVLDKNLGVHPSYVVISCGTGGKEGTNKEVGGSQEKNQFDHPTVKLLKLLISYFNQIDVSKQNGVYTTWMSRRLTYFNNLGVDYVTPNGTNNIYITQSDIMFRIEDGKLKSMYCQLPEYTLNIKNEDENVNLNASTIDEYADEFLNNKAIELGIKRDEFQYRRFLSGGFKMKLQFRQPRKRKRWEVFAEGELRKSEPPIKKRKFFLEIPEKVILPLSAAQYKLKVSNLKNPWIAGLLKTTIGPELNIAIESQKKQNNYTEYSGYYTQSFSIPGFKNYFKNFSLVFKVYDITDSPNIKLVSVSATTGTSLPIVLTAKPSSTSFSLYFTSKEASKETLLKWLDSFHVDVKTQLVALSVEDDAKGVFMLSLSAFSGIPTTNIAIETTSKDLAFDLPGISGTTAITLARPTTHFGENVTVLKNDLSVQTIANGSAVLNISGEQSADFECQFFLSNENHLNIQLATLNNREVSFVKTLATFGILSSTEEHSVFKAFPGLKDFSFRKFSIAVDPQNKFSFVKASLTCDVETDNANADLNLTVTNHSSLNVHCAISFQNTGRLHHSKLIEGAFNILEDHFQISGFTVDADLTSGNFSCALGIESDWSFNIGPSPFTLKNVTIDLTYQDKTIEALASASWRFGSLNFDLWANYDSVDKSWSFGTEGALESEVHLSNVISDLAKYFHFPKPDPKAIPDVMVQAFDMSFNTKTHEFHFDLNVELQKPGIGPFNSGNVNLSISLDKTKNNKGTHDFCMNLDGIININNTELDINGTDIGRKDWAVDIVWDHKENESLSILDIGMLFGLNTENPDLQKVKDLLTLNHLEWNYQHGYPAKGEEDALPSSFLLNAKLGKDTKKTVEGLFSGKKPNTDNQGWDFLIGIGYTDHTQIPVIGKRIPDFKLDDAWLLINTADTKANLWPPLPPDFPKTVEQQSVEKGLIALAKLDLAESKNSKIPGASQLKDSLPHTALDLLVELDGEGLLMKALLEGAVSIPTGQGHTLVVSNAGIQLKITPDLSASIALWGLMGFKLDTVSDTLKIELAVDETGIELLADSKFGAKGWKPFGLKDVFIDELDLALGIDFEPPGIRIGFEGEMHLKDQTKDAEKLAIVLEFTEPIPNPEYLAIAIKQLKLSDILNLFEGSSKEGHDQIKNSIAEIDDFAVVWCEKPIVLPDGKTAQIGFSCHGAVKILSWGAYIRLDVHPQTGIQGMGELSPVKIGPLQITGKGTGVSVKQQQLSDGTWQNVSNVVINPKKKELSTSTHPTRMHQLIAPGGAIIQFNSSGVPYLNLSIGVQFFEVKIAEIDAAIDKDSFTFDMLLNLAGIAGFKVHAHIQQQPELLFNISGAFFLGIHFVIDIHLPWPLPHIHLDFQLGINASMEVSKDKEGYALKLGGGVLFMGHKIDLGDFEIHGIPDSLGKLPSWIYDYIETGHVPKFKQHISDGSGVNTDNPYNKKKTELAEEMLAKAKEWASFVHRDIEKLKQERNLSIDKIQQLIENIKADTRYLPLCFL